MQDSQFSTTQHDSLSVLSKQCLPKLTSTGAPFVTGQSKLFPELFGHIFFHTSLFAIVFIIAVLLEAFAGKSLDDIPSILRRSSSQHHIWLRLCHLQNHHLWPQHQHHDQNQHDQFSSIRPMHPIDHHCLAISQERKRERDVPSRGPVIEICKSCSAL